jgi:hypothetical protein
MDSSSTSKRKLRAFVPDVPYHIQLIFVLSFSYIWYSAFIDKDYLEPLDNKANADEITVSII